MLLKNKDGQIILRAKLNKVQYYVTPNQEVTNH